LKKGTYPKNYFASESNDVLLNKAKCVNISLGIDTLTANDTIDNLKCKELDDRTSFEEKNPEVSLPDNLDSVLVDEEFPPFTSTDNTPIKGNLKDPDSSWVQVASKGKDSNLQIGGK
jgi:hypothetical protein